MKNTFTPLRPPCGLTQEKVISLKDDVPLVDGDCQNGYLDTGGIKKKCGMPVGSHPSELTASAGADAIDELRKKVDELVYHERLRGDSRLFYFGPAAPSSSGRHTQADTFIDLCYQGTCVLCGSKEDVSRAHLVSGSHETTYPEFGPPNYSDTLNVKSSRNFIPLCGTKGKRSTCHDAFDTFRLTILWNPLGAHYYCFCLDRSFEKYAALHLKRVSFHEDHKPYNRLLAWHTRKCAIVHSYWVSGDDVSNLLCAVDMSETMSTGHEDSSRSSSAAAV